MKPLWNVYETLTEPLRKLYLLYPYLYIRVLLWIMSEIMATTEITNRGGRKMVENFVLAGKAKTVFQLIELKARKEMEEVVRKARKDMEEAAKKEQGKQ